MKDIISLKTALPVKGDLKEMREGKKYVMIARKNTKDVDFVKDVKVNSYIKADLVESVKNANMFLKKEE